MDTGCGPHVVVGLGHPYRDQRMLEVGAHRYEPSDTCRARLRDRGVIVVAQVAVVVDPRHRMINP